MAYCNTPRLKGNFIVETPILNFVLQVPYMLIDLYTDMSPPSCAKSFYKPFWSWIKLFIKLFSLILQQARIIVKPKHLLIKSLLQFSDFFKLSNILDNCPTGFQINHINPINGANGYFRHLLGFGGFA